MTNENSTPIETDAPKQKRSLRNPFKTNDTTTDTSKLDNIMSKSKTVLAVVGAVTVVSVASGVIAKRKGIDSVEVNLPSVDTDTDV